MIIKEKNSPKIFKILKILKKEKKQNQRQNQRLWHSLRSCRFKSKSKVKSIDNVFAALILFEKQKLQCVARRHSLKNISVIPKEQKQFFGGGNKRIFFVSLVDTRLVNPSLRQKKKTKRTECERITIDRLFPPLITAFC